MPAAPAVHPRLCLHAPGWVPNPAYLPLPAAATPHLPTGSPHPSPHFTSQQNGNVISTLQAGELMSPDGSQCMRTGEGWKVGGEVPGRRGVLSFSQ